MEYYERMAMLRVEPQAFGKHVNTERLAATNRLTELAAEHYFRWWANRDNAMIREVWDFEPPPQAYGAPVPPELPLPLPPTMPAASGALRKTVRCSRRT